MSSVAWLCCPVQTKAAHAVLGPNPSHRPTTEDELILPFIFRPPCLLSSAPQSAAHAHALRSHLLVRRRARHLLPSRLQQLTARLRDSPSVPQLASATILLLSGAQSRLENSRRVRSRAHGRPRDEYRDPQLHITADRLAASSLLSS